MKEIQEDDNYLLHKYVFDAKLEKLVNKNSYPNQEVMSPVFAQSSDTNDLNNTESDYEGDGI